MWSSGQAVMRAILAGACDGARGVSIEDAMRSRLAELAGRAEAPVFAALRIVAGALFSFHGMQKLFGWPPSGHTGQLLTQRGAAGVIELVCGVLVAIGLVAR